MTTQMSTVLDDEAIIASTGPSDCHSQRLDHSSSSDTDPLMEDVSMTRSNALEQPLRPAEDPHGQHLLSGNGIENEDDVSPRRTAAIAQLSPDNLAAQDNAIRDYVRELESFRERACQEIQRLAISEKDLKAQTLPMRCEFEGLVRSETMLNQDMRNMRRDIAHLRNQNVQLRDVILKSAGTQKITDEEVVQAFRGLRQSVQQLASSSIFGLTAVTAHGPCPRLLYIRPFYNVCRGLRGQDITHRVKAEIFASLHQLILSRTCFGLTRATFFTEENENLWNMDESLLKFEQYLMADPKVSQDVVASWRVCTLQCVELLKLPEEYSRLVAAEIHDLFVPFISKQASRSQRSALWKKTLEVCQMSVKLKTLMQRSNEGYAVQLYDVENFPAYSKNEHVVEAMGVENGTIAEASDEVAYLLFGVLTKNIRDNDDEKQILIKAEVVLKKRREKEDCMRQIGWLSYRRYWPTHK